MAKKRRLPEIGDRVVIAWAGRVVEVEVDEIYGPADNLRMMVWMPIHGSSGEVLERKLHNVPFSTVQEIRISP
ncbi:MAG: hypothetical protein ACRD0K_09945 [Egibacteraceae bacterium]